MNRAKNGGPVRTRRLDPRRKWLRYLAAIARACLVFLLIGAGPASEGTRVSTGAGARMRQYTVFACDSGGGDRHHRDVDALAAFAVKYRSPGGFTAALETDGAYRVAALDDSGGPGAYGHGSARLGYHGEMGGFELGAVGGSNSILPAAEVWMGHPKIYLWGTGLSDSAFHSYSLVKAGLGRATEDLRFNFGASIAPRPGSPEEEPQLEWLAIGDIDGRVTNRFWLGGSFEFGDVNTWTAMLKLSWQIGGGTDEQQAQPP